MADVSLQSLFEEARGALDAGNADQAVAIVRHILQHAPDVIEGHRLLGEAYLNAGQTEQAVAALETVLRADPENVSTYYGLGLAQQSLDRRRDAIRSFERALEIQPNLAELRGQLLRLYAETPGSTGQFRLSRAGLGRLYARGQMYSQAIDEFRAVLDAEPERDDVRVALAETLWRDGQEDEAADWCRELLQRHSELHKPTLILGYLQLAAGQPEGEALWRRAGAQDPSLQTAHSLFDIMPPVQVEEPAIPAFDERAWLEQQRTAAERPVEVMPVAVGDDDEFFDQPSSGSIETATTPHRTMEEPAVPALPAATSVAAEEPAQGEAAVDDQVAFDDESLSDDALLASLLGFDDEDGADVGAPYTPAPVGHRGSDEMDTSPVSFDERGSIVSGDEDDRSANVARFSFDDLEGVREAPLQLARVHDARENADGTRSFGFEDEDDPDNHEPQPFSLDDIDGSAQPFSFEDHPMTNDEGDDLGAVQPFSLNDWNFESSDEAQAGASSGGETQPETAPDARPDGVRSFSLDDQAPDAHEDRLVAAREDAQDETETEDANFTWDEASRPSEALTAAEPTSDTSDDDGDGQFFSIDDVAPANEAEDEESDTAEEEGLPFSLSELGLADEDVGARGETTGSTEVTTRTDQEFEPFSLRELGVDEGEQARDDAAGGDETEAQPFALEDLGLDEQSVRAGRQEGDESIDDMIPFSFADLELEEDESTSGYGPESRAQDVDVPFAGDAPGGKAPFSLADLFEDDQPAPGVDGAPTAPPTGSVADTSIDEETTPFSLADLGLTDEELAQLGLGEQVSAPEAGEGNPSLEDTGVAADDEMTPFSLADLGLTDEELEGFGVGPEQPAVGDVQAGSTGQGPTSSVTQPFSMAELGLDDELAAESVADVDPQDVFDPQPSIHDADTTPFTVVPTTPETSPAPSASDTERPDRVVESGAGAAMFSGGDEPEPPELPPVPAELGRFYQQLEAQPDNHAMRLALARMSEQRHDADRALEQYKQLIRRGALLDLVIEDLRELTSDERNHPLQRRLHRLLGDAYIKQERFEEAMAEYSRT